MKKQIILLIVSLILIVGFLSGCEQKNNGTKIDPSKLELVNYSIEVLEDMTGEEFRQITGYVKNNAGKSIELLEINITFYDDDNNFILTKSSYIRDISNEQKKEFSTVYHSLTPHYYIVNWENIEFEITIDTY